MSAVNYWECPYYLTGNNPNITWECSHPVNKDSRCDRNNKYHGDKDECKFTDIPVDDVDEEEDTFSVNFHCIKNWEYILHKKSIRRKK